MGQPIRVRFSLPAPPIFTEAKRLRYEASAKLRGLKIEPVAAERSEDGCRAVEGCFFYKFMI